MKRPEGSTCCAAAVENVRYIVDSVTTRVAASFFRYAAYFLCNFIVDIVTRALRTEATPFPPPATSLAALFRVYQSRSAAPMPSPASQLDRPNRLAPSTMSVPLKTRRRQPSAGAKAAARALARSIRRYRLAQQASHAAQWWAAQPSPRPDYYAAPALRDELCVARLPVTALRWLGWRTQRHTFRGRQRTVWLPPGSRMRPYPKGRPRLYPPHLLPLDFKPYTGKD